MFLDQLNANTILLKSAAIRRKEAIKQRQTTIASVLVLAFILPASVIAEKLQKPEVVYPEPCNMSSYYLSQLELEEQKKEYTQQKLREARKQLNELKQKEQQSIKITAPGHTTNSIQLTGTGFPSFFKSAWESAIEATLKHEGGLVLDSNGYMAKFGINQAYYQPLSGFPERVHKLTVSQAKQYYKRHYWSPLKLEHKGYSKAYQMFIFDAAVNSGVGYAQKLDARAKGSLKQAKALRAAHCMRWAFSSSHNRKYLKGLIARIHTYTEATI